jgi:hypothetical protein
MTSKEDDYIHQLTLECLVNKEMYKKYENSKETSRLNQKDKKFYRKRILALTKDLLYESDMSANILLDVKDTFHMYIKTCMRYFKSQDKCDILQEDYLDILEKSLNEKSDPSDYNEIETNKVMMRTIPFKKNTLDKFVKHVTNIPEKEPILPKKRSVNLKDPLLKDKGIEKNKNITNNYDKKDHKKKESSKKQVKNEKKISNKISETSTQQIETIEM